MNTKNLLTSLIANGSTKSKPAAIAGAIFFVVLVAYMTKDMIPSEAVKTLVDQWGAYVAAVLYTVQNAIEGVTTPKQGD